MPSRSAHFAIADSLARIAAVHEQVREAAVDRVRLHEPARPRTVARAQLPPERLDGAEPLDLLDADGAGLQRVVQVVERRRDPVGEDDHRASRVGGSPGRTASTASGGPSRTPDDLRMPRGPGP